MHCHILPVFAPYLLVDYGVPRHMQIHQHSPGLVLD